MKFSKYLQFFRQSIFSLVLLLGSAFMFYCSFAIQALSTNADNLGPGFVPKVVFSCLIFLAALLLIGNFSKEYKAYCEKKFEGEDKPDEEDLRRITEKKIATKRILIAVAGLVFMLLFMEALGFIITCSLYLFSQIFLLAPADKRHPVKYAVASAVFVFICYYIFRMKLYIMLPPGILG